VGNWRVVNHDTARLLAERGAHLVHSAPAVGVRDWSDLRIAVDAGVWLAQARPGDLLEIVTDDQAFDAVGDVATSLGVGFRRLSFRALAGAGVEPPPEEARAREPHGRRRRRGGRRGRREEAAPAPSRPIATAANGGEPAGGSHRAGRAGTRRGGGRARSRRAGGSARGRGRRRGADPGEAPAPAPRRAPSSWSRQRAGGGGVAVGPGGVGAWSPAPCPSSSSSPSTSSFAA